MLNEEKAEQYVLGLDFGTLSVRAVVVRVSDGYVFGDAVREYATPIMDLTLTAGDNRPLPAEFALQVPGDYRDAMRAAVPEAVKKSGIDPQKIIGIGIDSTSATVIVTDEAGVPLCEDPRFVNEPHAYLKLWKHHGAQSQVERIIALAKERNESWLSRYGGTLSSEMMLPKCLEILEKAPEVYHAAAEIVDLPDWVTWLLSGNLVYSAGSSGYKRMYQDGTYPSEEYLGLLHPEFATIYADKMSHEVVSLGSSVGGLIKEWAEAFGVPEGITVAAGNIDAHVHAASVDAVRPGQLTGILGTSTCWILPSATCEDVPGIFGVVDGGVADGSWGYEAGQSAVGDSFAWFIENNVPDSYYKAAQEQGISIHEYLQQQADLQEVGEHGLVALDWWNGNRSILVDSNMSGLMVGQTLVTTPVDQYRALLESTAFGARVIIENFEEHGVPINEIRVAGGLLKSAFLMQMYADITRRPLRTANTTQAGAHGSAVFAAVAAGAYPSLADASASMGGVSETVYQPREEKSALYDKLYEQYVYLYNLFGRENSVMRTLKEMRAKVREGR